MTVPTTEPAGAPTAEPTTAAPPTAASTAEPTTAASAAAYGSCLFCRIVGGALAAAEVARTEHTLAFLDHAPVFPGHVLIVPRVHHETLADLPAELIEPLFAEAQRIARAVESALDAQGTWVSMNNRVSQSVPHLHVHVVPRRRKDGLRGFYWPRVKYPSTDAMHETAARIAAAL
jgi:histidine triad (HIT) family protein